MAAMMTDSMSSDKSGFGALGMMFGMAMLDRMVDAMVRPEMLMLAMRNARVASPQDSRASAPASSTAARNSASTEWTTERRGVDRVIAYGKEAGASDDKRVGFVFDRNGFASWKLSEIRLPAAK
jgi:hypothetical protein